MTNKARLKELLIQYGKDNKIANLDANKLSDYLLSNGVIAPRFRIGEKAWFICEMYTPDGRELVGYKLKCAKIERIYIDYDDFYSKQRVPMITYGTETIYQGNAYCPCYDFDSSTVFKSEKEAQQVLNDVGEYVFDE